MNNWSNIDFFIFLIFVVNTLLGLSRGATKEILSMICLNVALIFAIKFTLPLATFLDRSPLVQDVLTSRIAQNFTLSIGAGSLTESLLKELSYCLSLVICFAGAFCTCEAVLAFTGAIELFTFSYAAWNRKIGGSLGFIRGYIFTLIIVLMMSHLYSITGISASGSYFSTLFQGTAKKLDDFIGGQQVERYKEIYKDKNLYNENEMLKSLSSPP
jgi:uncharacterized membrane protein required for colicin V production